MTHKRDAFVRIGHNFGARSVLQDEVMDFEQLRIFLVLAEEGTFLGAATRLQTSRSRVRRKLDLLEAAAGTPLINRDPGGMKLTPAGRVLALRGRALVEEAEHLVSRVHEVGEVPTGCLKIAMPIGPPPAGWDEIRRQLFSRYPDLQIEIFFSERPAGLLPSRAEVALTFEEEIPESFRVVELGERAIQLVVDDRYVGVHGCPSRIEELVDHRVAVWRRLDKSSDQLPLIDGRVLDIRPCLISDQASLLYQMVAAGDCIAFVPELPELMAPTLMPLFAESVVGVVRERLTVPEILADLPRVQQFLALSTQIGQVLHD